VDKEERIRCKDKMQGGERIRRRQSLSIMSPNPRLDNPAVALLLTRDSTYKKI